MLEPPPLFADRRDAGRKLAEALRARNLVDPLILALPRGGVVVGDEIARALRAPLHVLLVRKLGAPGAPELAIGALVDGDPPQAVWNDDVVGDCGADPGWCRAEVARQERELARRRALYGAAGQAPPVAGRTVVVVDDGIATGATMRAALRALGQAGAARRVAAVPVAPPRTVERLRRDADDVVCLAAPDPFMAISPFYRDFAQVSDSEVLDLLERRPGAHGEAGTPRPRQASSGGPPGS